MIIDDMVIGGIYR